ncbi:MAG: PEP-CTERM sorting domain-containing protein [Phycisphaerales bacterium]
MNRKFFIASAIAAVSIASAASADIIAAWQFSEIGNNVGASYSVGAATSGAQTAGSTLGGVHASATTTWSSPVGNGNSDSFSANGWAIGDYFQWTVNTTSYSGVTVSFDSARSNTGPATFELLMSTDGGSTWSTLIASTAVQVSATPNSWNSTTRQMMFNFNTVAAGADNQTSVSFRWRATAAPTGSQPAQGTTRIDNVQITGTLVPAPGALALLGAAGMLGLRRRRA